MDNREITKAILKDEKLTQVQFCEKLGITQGYLSARMRNCYSADAMYRYLSTLGYEMVIRKKDKKKAPEYVLEVRTLNDED